MLSRLRAWAIPRPSNISRTACSRYSNSHKPQAAFDLSLATPKKDSKPFDSHDKDRSTTQRERQAANKQSSEPMPSFRDELFIPSIHMNSSLFEFKIKFLNCKNKSEIIPKLKLLIKEFTKECESPDKFNKVIYKLEPIINETLISVDNSSFVDLFTYLSSQNIKINNEQVTFRFIKFLTSDISIQDKYNLLFCARESLPDSELDVSILRNPLTKDQITKIAKTYSASIVKAIIHSFYLPLYDSSKISEYLEILYLQHPENPEKINPFKCYVNFLLGTNKLDVTFSKKYSVSYLCGLIVSLTRNEVEIPPNFSKNLWHQILIAEYFQQVSPEVLYTYLTIFYNDFLPTELDHFKATLGVKPLNNDLKRKLSFLMSKEELIPPNIQILFFDKIMSEEDTSLIKSLIQSFKAMHPNTPAKQGLRDAFRFSVFKYALTIKDKKPGFFQYLMEYFSEEAFVIPAFKQVQLVSIFNYYRTDFNGFIQYLNSVNRSKGLYRLLDAQEVQLVSKKLGHREKEVFIQTLIKNDFVFNSSSAIQNWIKENPRTINYILSGGKLNPDMRNGDLYKSSSLFRLSTIFTPKQMFKLIVDYDADSCFTKEILSTFKVYNDDFDYICAQLKALPLVRGKTSTYIDVLTSFMKKHNLENEILTTEQKLRLYTIYIAKIIDINHLAGLIVACALIPSFKKQILKLTGMSESHLFSIKRTEYILTDEFDIPPSMIIHYVTRYSDSRHTNGKLWATMFKNALMTASTLKDTSQKELLFCQLFKIFQIKCVQKMFSPLTLIKIYQLAETHKVKPEWKLPINMNKYLESYYSTDIGEIVSLTGVSVRETISMIAKYESNVELSSSLVSKLFSEVPDDEKIFFLVSLRNLMLSVPFAKNIHDYIHSRFEANDPEIYRLFGLEIENPLTNNPNSRRPKWMRFDVRYFSPLLEIFMKDIISKEQNISIKHMMVDSLATMRCDANSNVCIEFYEMFNKVVLFGGNLKAQGTPSQEIDEIIAEFKEVFKLNQASRYMPEYLVNPFAYHFLYTRIFAYDLKTIIKLLYILTRGDKLLAENGFWELDEENEFGELKEKFGAISLTYDIKGDLDLMSFYRLVFTAAKNTNEVPTSELTYIINISENLLKSESISKRNKYWIMNCTLILVGKHSDLLSAFYKKTQQLLPEYKVTNTVIAELLYSTITNDIRDIDSMLDYMIGTHETHVMHQSCESVIKRLIAEEQNGLAQELYVKYTERKPRFKIPDLNDTLSWGKARQPIVTIDSNDGVNMKMDRYKVKLYDYDSLDKQKS